MLRAIFAIIAITGLILLSAPALAGRGHGHGHGHRHHEYGHRVHARLHLGHVPWFGYRYPYGYSHHRHNTLYHH